MKTRIFVLLSAIAAFAVQLYAVDEGKTNFQKSGTYGRPDRFAYMD